jgi:hypothetical protein
MSVNKSTEAISYSQVGILGDAVTREIPSSEVMRVSYSYNFALDIHNSEFKLFQILMFVVSNLRSFVNS